MCGIFGACILPGSGFSTKSVRRLSDSLFRLSETRGREAAGLAMYYGDKVLVYKRPVTAARMIAEPAYGEAFQGCLDLNGSGKPNSLERPLVFIGHSRLTTNGTQYVNENNHPVVRDQLVLVHNGIITNEPALADQYPTVERRSEVDTDALLGVVQHLQSEGRSLSEAVATCFQQIEGTASIALLEADLDALVLATNCGSLYTCHDAGKTTLIFASERYILQQLLSRRELRARYSASTISPVRANRAHRVTLGDLTVSAFDLAETRGRWPLDGGRQRVSPSIVDHAAEEAMARETLRRCGRCVLPETVPFIEFDADRVCNFCREYRPMEVAPHEQLESDIERHRSKDGEPDCIVMLSGGRDSCYGLYHIKDVLGMNPIAYSYDWGGSTDLARRNSARMCGRLGVEHVIVSADIARKRRNVRKNVQAWLKRPELGMIPLFLAGDKQYFFYANRLRKQTGIDLVFVCECPLELTKFKAGFCGVREGDRRTFDVGLPQKLSLVGYYARQYLANPAYFNSSLFDSAFAFYVSYFLDHDYMPLYRYQRWDERVITSVLIDEFGWETAPDTRSTWRIGDGTTAFYNYIYYVVAGFTENDTLRSNQVREGDLDRDEALELVHEENKPRWESMEWYARTIGFDLHQALSVIHAVPKLYGDSR